MERVSPPHPTRPHLRMPSVQQQHQGSLGWFDEQQPQLSRRSSGHTERQLSARRNITKQQSFASDSLLEPDAGSFHALRQQQQVELLHSSSVSDKPEKQELYPYSRGSTQLQRPYSAMFSRRHVLPSIPEQHQLEHRASIEQLEQEELSRRGVPASNQRLPDSLSGLPQSPFPTIPEQLSSASSSQSRDLSSAAFLKQQRPQHDYYTGGRQRSQRASVAPGMYDSPLRRRTQNYVPVPEAEENLTAGATHVTASGLRHSSADKFEREHRTQQRAQELLQQRVLHLQKAQRQREAQELRLQRGGSIKGKGSDWNTYPASLSSRVSEGVTGAASNELTAAVTQPRQRDKLLFYRYASAPGLPQSLQQQNQTFRQSLSLLPKLETQPVGLGQSGVTAVSPAADTHVSPSAGAASPSSISSRPSPSTPRSLPSFLQRLKLPRGSAPAAGFPLHRKTSVSSSDLAPAATDREPATNLTTAGQPRVAAYPHPSRRRARTTTAPAEGGVIVREEPLSTQEQKSRFAAMRRAISSSVGRLTKSKSDSLKVHEQVLRSSTVHCKSKLPAVVVAFTLPAVAAAFAPLCPAELPHALLPLCGVPLLLFALNFLHRNEVTEILLLVKDDPEGHAIKAAAAAYEAFLRTGMTLSRRHHGHNQHRQLSEENDKLHQLQQGRRSLQRQGSSYVAEAPRIEVVELSPTVNSVGDALREFDSRADIRTDFLLMLMGTVAAADLQPAVAVHKQRAAAAAAAGAALACATSAADTVFSAARQGGSPAAASVSFFQKVSAAADSLETAAAGGGLGGRQQLLTQIFVRVTPSSPHRLLEDDAAVLIDASTHRIVAVKSLSSSNRGSNNGSSTSSSTKDSSASSDTDKLLNEEGLGVFFEDETLFVSAGAQLQLHYDLVDVGLYLCSPKVLTSFSCCFDYSSVKEDLIPAAVQQANLSKRNAAVYAHILETGDFEYDVCSFPFAVRVVDPRTLFWTSRSMLERWAYPMVPETLAYLFGLPANERILPCGRGAYRAVTAVTAGPYNQVAPLVFIGDGTRIDKSARLRGSIVGARCSIHSGVFVEDSILFDDVVLEEGVHVLQSLIAANCIIKRAAVISRGCVLCHCVVIEEGVEVVPFTRLYSANLLQLLQQQRERQQQRQKQQPEDSQILLQQACRSIIRRGENATRTFHMPHNKSWIAAVSVGGSVAPLVTLPLPRFRKWPPATARAAEGEQQGNRRRTSTSMEFTSEYPGSQSTRRYSKTSSTAVYFKN